MINVKKHASIIWKIIEKRFIKFTTLFSFSRVSGFIGGIFGNFECTFEKKFFMPDKIFFSFFMYFTSKKYIHI